MKLTKDEQRVFNKLREPTVKDCKNCKHRQSDPKPGSSFTGCILDERNCLVSIMEYVDRPTLDSTDRYKLEEKYSDMLYDKPSKWEWDGETY